MLVEGPDLVGKTHLCQHSGLRWRRTTERTRANAYRFALWQARVRGYAHDRWWPTEVIYSRVLERVCLIDDWQAWCCCLEALNAGQSLVVLDEHNATLEARWEREPQRNLTRYQWECVVSAYRLFPWHHWYPASHSRVADAGVRPFAHSWGSHFPRYLLVAERPNARKVPAFVARSRPLMPAHSSHGGAYLFRALRAVAIRPFDVHLANAFLPNGEPEDLGRLWRYLGKPRILALGRVADRALRDLPHNSVDHPQYMRRFWSGCEERYGKEIRDAAQC